MISARRTAHERARRDWETPHAEVDLRVGGAIRITMRDPHPSVQQLIEVDFTDHGDHTTVVLTDSGIPAQAKDDHLVGWQNSFDNLDAALAR